MPHQAHDIPAVGPYVDLTSHWSCKKVEVKAVTLNRGSGFDLGRKITGSFVLTKHLHLSPLFTRSDDRT